MSRPEKRWIYERVVVVLAPVAAMGIVAEGCKTKQGAGKDDDE